MSADNWAVCPQCQDLELTRIAEAEAKVAASYGNVSVTEYEMLKAALKPIDLETFRTFREDYEFYGSDEGTLIISYKGGCDTCGLELNVHEERPLYTPVNRLLPDPGF